MDEDSEVTANLTRTPARPIRKLELIGFRRLSDVSRMMLRPVPMLGCPLSIDVRAVGRLGFACLAAGRTTRDPLKEEGSAGGNDLLGASFHVL